MKDNLPIKVLVACEESQRVTKELRKLGIEAYSCDILPCSGGRPEWHIRGDAIQEAYTGKYDMMIAHPPCTYIANSGARWLFKGGALNLERYDKGLEAKEFFMRLLDAPIEHIAVENPIPSKIFGLPKYDQIVQPWQFGDEAQKSTCIWLKNLPKLEPTDIVGKGEFTYYPSGKRIPTWYNTNSNGSKNRQQSRSVTFMGIARAMARQWHNVPHRETETKVA